MVNDIQNINADVLERDARQRIGQEKGKYQKTRRHGFPVSRSEANHAYSPMPSSGIVQLPG